MLASTSVTGSMTTSSFMRTGPPSEYAAAGLRRPRGGECSCESGVTAASGPPVSPDWKALAMAVRRRKDAGERVRGGSAGRRPHTQVDRDGRSQVQCGADGCMSTRVQGGREPLWAGTEVLQRRSRGRRPPQRGHLCAPVTRGRLPAARRRPRARQSPGRRPDPDSYEDDKIATGVTGAWYEQPRRSSQAAVPPTCWHAT